MILNGDFFKIDQALPAHEGMLFGYDITLSPQHFIFKSHFPGHPITPGVCLIEIVNELAQEALGVPLYVREIKSIKYVGVIEPTTNNHLRVIYTSCSELTTGVFKIQACISDACNPATVFCKFSITSVTTLF